MRRFRVGGNAESGSPGLEPAFEETLDRRERQQQVSLDARAGAGGEEPGGQGEEGCGGQAVWVEAVDGQGGNVGGVS